LGLDLKKGFNWDLGPLRRDIPFYWILEEFLAFGKFQLGLVGLREVYLRETTKGA